VSSRSTEEVPRQPSIYDATAPSGPWPPSSDASSHPYFQLFSSIFLSPAAVMHPSRPRPPICFLVFTVALCCRSFHLKPFLVSFLLPFSLRDLPITIFCFQCPPRCLAPCTNCTVHCSVWDSSVRLLVLRHIFFAIFSFQTCLETALLFVLVSRSHFHNTILA